MPSAEHNVLVRTLGFFGPAFLQAAKVIRTLLKEESEISQLKE